MGNLIGLACKAPAGTITASTPLILGLGAICLIAFAISQTNQGTIKVSQDGLEVEYAK